MEIWAKYFIKTKICCFEFMLSLITSGLKDLWSWNLVQASFLAWEVQKLHLEYTKTNQGSVISHFKFQLCLTGSGTGKLCGTTIIPKKFFLQKLKTLIWHFAKIGTEFSVRPFKIMCQSWGSFYIFTVLFRSLKLQNLIKW